MTGFFIDKDWYTSMIKTIRLKTVKGGGNKSVFVAKNIAKVQPYKDNNSLVFVVGDSKGVEVYESADEIDEMIRLETLGNQPSSTFQPAYPQIEHE